MTKNWTGDLVGLMHDYKITGRQLAGHLGITDRYVSMILNGKRHPPNAEERLRRAVEELISSRSQDHSISSDVR